jgi:hypothetical protein
MREPRDAGEKKVLDDVKARGWHVMKVLEDNQGPGFAYTIGLQHSFQHPELIVVGLPADLSHLTLNIAGQANQRGARFVVGQQTHLFFEDRVCTFRMVPEAQFLNYLGWDLWFYDGPVFTAMQLLWPDAQGRFPWSIGVEVAFRDLQPVLEELKAP